MLSRADKPFNLLSWQQGNCMPLLCHVCCFHYIWFYASVTAQSAFLIPSLVSHVKPNHPLQAVKPIQFWSSLIGTHPVWACWRLSRDAVFPRFFMLRLSLLLHWILPQCHNSVNTPGTWIGPIGDAKPPPGDGQLLQLLSSLVVTHRCWEC